MNESEAKLDVPLGITFESPSRTISEGEFTLLNDLTWNVGRLHTDKEHMVRSRFGERILPGNIVLALMGGLADVMGLTDHAFEKQYGIQIIALLGYENVRFRAPLLPGDTIRCTFEVLSVRPSKVSGQGVLNLKGTCLKNDDHVIADAIQIFLYEKLNQIS